MRTRLVYFFFFLVCFQARSQVNSEFVDYLVISELNKEHKTYLDQLTLDFGETDSVRYYKTKFDLLTNNYDSFQNEFNSCKLCWKDTSLINYSSIHLIRFSIERANKFWKADSTYGSFVSKNSILRKSYNLSLNPKLDDSFLPYELKFHFQEYKSAYNKKAWVAGLLSAAIPASGKLYIGRGNSFFGAFALNVVHGIILYEAINRKGIEHPYTIVSAGFFGVFYFSNIFGTIHDLKRVKNERRKHFLYEVADYQSADLYLYE